MRFLCFCRGKLVFNAGSDSVVSPFWRGSFPHHGVPENNGQRTHLRNSELAVEFRRRGMTEFDRRGLPPCYWSAGALWCKSLGPVSKTVDPNVLCGKFST